MTLHQNKWNVRLHVVGQLVDLEDDGLDMRLNKTPKYLNITLRNYLKLGQCNQSFERYRKYEIRSLVSFFFRMRHHKAHLSTFIENPCAKTQRTQKLIQSQSLKRNLSEYKPVRG